VFSPKQRVLALPALALATRTLRLVAFVVFAAAAGDEYVKEFIMLAIAIACALALTARPRDGRSLSAGVLLLQRRICALQAIRW
jgi:hypothetical protein